MFFKIVKLVQNNSKVANKRQRKPKEKSRMDNPETLATLGTLDTGRKQTHTTQDENTHTTQHRTNTNTHNTGRKQTHTTQDENTHTQHRTKTHTHNTGRKHTHTHTHTQHRQLK